jgi:3-phosphoshikimate 1-carboxyvinyltransferase
VGEYPEGLVIDGGHPLQGTRIDSKGDPGVVQAFAVAGLLASGDMEIEGAECLDGVFPGFFDSLAILKGRKK